MRLYLRWGHKNSEIEIATNKIFRLNFQYHFSCCGRDLCSLFIFLTNNYVQLKFQIPLQLQKYILDSIPHACGYVCHNISILVLQRFNDRKETYLIVKMIKIITEVSYAVIPVNILKWKQMLKTCGKLKVTVISNQFKTRICPRFF